VRGRRMRCDRGPDCASQEIGRDTGSFNLETLIGAAVLGVGW